MRGKLKRVAAAVVALLVVLVVVRLALLGAASGRLEPPARSGDGRLAACPPTPNCVSSQATDVEQRVEPLPIRGDAATALAGARAALASMPRTSITVEAPGYVHAVATSALFRFVDDIELAVDGDAAVIHVRSASRVGHSDLGANRARVERLRELLAQP